MEIYLLHVMLPMSQDGLLQINSKQLAYIVFYIRITVIRYFNGLNTLKKKQKRINIIYFKHASPISVFTQSSGFMKQIKPRLFFFSQVLLLNAAVKLL